MENFGFLTLVPVILVIIIALKTRRILEALIVGTLVSYIIIGKWKFPQMWADAFFRAAADKDNQWVLMVCGIFGSFIAIVGASGGTVGFAHQMHKICRGKISTMLATWVLGIVIFLDDYLNIMTLSTCMKKLTDEKKVPRESLAYIIDSTGAPVCALLPFSTWAVFFATLFYQQPAVQALGYGSEIATYIQVMPYVFYAIIAVILVPLFIVGAVPKMGYMKKAYKRVEETGAVYSPASEKLNEEERREEEEEAEEERRCGHHNKGKAIDFILPLGLMIGITLATEELFLALMGALACCLALYIPRKKMGISKFCDLALKGFCGMVPTTAIIFFVFVMQEAMADIGIAQYLIEAVEPYLSVHLFPLIVFLLAALLSFATGSSWGIPAICVPVMIPLAAEMGANLLLVMAAIISGGTLGSHACFYSDATVLTSSCCKIQNMDHALSQINYAGIAAGLSSIGYLAFGYIM